MKISSIVLAMILIFGLNLSDGIMVHEGGHATHPTDPLRCEDNPPSNAMGDGDLEYGIIADVPYDEREEPQSCNSMRRAIIHLKYADFDPLEVVPAVPEDLRAYDLQVALVQMRGPVRSEWRAALERHAEILAFLKEHTYIVIPHDVNAIRALPFVRWMGPYHPAYKVDPDLLDASGEMEVEIDLFWGSCSLERATAMMKSLGADIIDDGRSNWVVKAMANVQAIKAISHLPWVEWIAPSAEMFSMMDNIRVYTGATMLHEIPFNGSGIVGEIKDNGIDADHPEFEGQIIGTDGDPGEADHGTSTFGIVFALGVNERARGMAPGAKGVFCDWGVGRYESIQHLVQNWGGVFQSNSWGQGSMDSTYNQYSQEDDRAVLDFDVVMLYASGNGGDDQSCTHDAVAKNVIAVGGLNHYDNRNRSDDRHTGNEGNKGPASDGRIKPDLCGPYDDIYTTTGNGGYTSSFGGTSGATPVNAGGIALIYQMYEEDLFGNNPTGRRPHASTVKAIAIVDAYQYEFTQADRYAQGWGVIDVANVYNISLNHFIVDEDVNLETGERAVFRVSPTGMHPLKISLVWTDFPGTTSSSRHLINDLDLKVISPNGVVYRGNHGLIEGKWSVEGGDRDDLNNVENVFIERPEDGEWTIEVYAYEVAQDADNSTSEVDQPFSLVVSGVIREDHELAIHDVFLPRYFEPGETVRARSLVSNIGRCNESEVMVRLYVDSVPVDQVTLDTIESGSTRKVTLLWVPENEGYHNLSLHVIPVKNESRTFNNWYNATVRVFRPIGRIVVDLVHGQDTHRHLLRTLEEKKFQIYWSAKKIDAVLDGKTLLAVFNPQSNYTRMELTTIRSFIKKGGGLIVVGDDDPDILGELTSYAGINWSSIPGLPGSTDEIESHNTTRNVSAMYFDSPSLTLDLNSPAQPVVRDETPIINNVLIAVSSFGRGRIVAVADDNCLDDADLDQEDNAIFGLNACRWLSNNPPVVEIISPEEGTIYSPSESIEFICLAKDPDGDSLDYLWISDVLGTLSTARSFTATLSAGVHHIVVIASDGLSNATDTVRITVNGPPSIRLIGPEDGAFVNGTVRLEWNATDPEGDPINYTVLMVSRTRSYVFENVSENHLEVSDLTVGETYTWRVSASDPYSTVWTRNRTFRYGNHRPEVVLLSPPPASRMPAEGTEFKWSALDHDGDPLTFRLYVRHIGLLYKGNETSFYMNNLTGGMRVSWWVVADDAFSSNTSARWSFTVNDPPRIEEHSPSDESMVSGHHVEFRLKSTDDDGDDVRITIYLDGNVLTEGVNFVQHVIALNPGIHTWHVLLTDGLDSFTAGPWTLRVNNPPAVNLLVPEDNSTVKDYVNLTWYAYDLDGDALHFTVYLGKGEAPPRLAETDLTHYALTLDEGLYRWRVVATDGIDMTSTGLWTFRVTAGSSPTVSISRIEPNPALVGETVTFQGEASDPDGDVVSVLWTSDIDGFLSDRLTFSTSRLSIGTHTIRLDVIDDDGNLAFDTATLSVLNSTAEPPIALVSVDEGPHYAGEVVTFDLAASIDPDGVVMLYILEFGDGTDSGWVETPIITHVYTQPGIYTVSARVRDGDGLESRNAAELSVVIAPHPSGRGRNDGDGHGSRIQDLLGPIEILKLSGLAVSALVIAGLLLMRAGRKRTVEEIYDVTPLDED